MRKLANKLVKKGSKFLEIDLSYFIKGGFWTSIPVFIEAIINILIVIIFTRVVSQTMYGEWRFYLSVLFIVSFFSLPGMGNAIIQSVAKKHYKSFVEGTKTRVKFSILGSLAFLCISAYFYLTGRNYLVLYFLLTAAIFPLFYSFKTYSEFLLGKEEYKKQAKYYTAYLLIINFLFVSSIILTKNITIIILTYILAGSLTHIFMYILVKNKYKKEIKKSKKDPGLTKYGTHISLMLLPPLISSNIDKILISYFLGFKVVASYAIAQTIAQQNKLSIRPLMRMLLPKLSRHKPLETFIFLRKKIFYIISISTLICIVGIILSPFVIKILFPSEYKNAIIIAQLLFIGQIFTLGNVVFSNYLTSQKWMKSLYKMTIYPDSLRILILVVLLPFIGIWGVILSEIVRNYFFFGLTLYLSKKEAYNYKK